MLRLQLVLDGRDHASDYQSITEPLRPIVRSGSLHELIRQLLVPDKILRLLRDCPKHKQRKTARLCAIHTTHLDQLRNELLGVDVLLARDELGKGGKQEEIQRLQRLLHHSAIVIQQRGNDASTILSRNLLRLYSISDETRLLRFSSSLLLSESLESS